jgi:hypothetical protein
MLDIIALEAKQAIHSCLANVLKMCVGVLLELLQVIIISRICVKWNKITYVAPLNCLSYCWNILIQDCMIYTCVILLFSYSPQGQILFHTEHNPSSSKTHLLSQNMLSFNFFLWNECWTEDLVIAIASRIVILKYLTGWVKNRNLFSHSTGC